jgi:6-phosphogluconolactonase
MTNGLESPTGEPTCRVLPDAHAVGTAAAEHISRALRAAVERSGRADWATTGGSAAVGMYRPLAEAPLRDSVPWQVVHVWWGDDRYVPRDHPQSNVKAVDAVLLNSTARSGQSGFGEDGKDVLLGIDPGAPIPTANIHPIPAAEALGNGGGPAWAAARYEEELRGSGIEQLDGWPAFDLLVLGIGPDGHLLSVFPGSAALDEERSWVLPIPAPAHVEPHVARITLNPRVIAAARDVLVVTHGEGKADILGTVFGPQRDVRRWPAQLARGPGATWLLDEAAAAGLPAELRS